MLVVRDLVYGNRRQFSSLSTIHLNMLYNNSTMLRVVLSNLSPLLVSTLRHIQVADIASSVNMILSDSCEYVQVMIYLKHAQPLTTITTKCHNLIIKLISTQAVWGPTHASEPRPLTSLPVHTQHTYRSRREGSVSTLML